MDYLKLFPVIVIVFVIIKFSVNVYECLSGIHYELKRCRIKLEKLGDPDK